MATLTDVTLAKPETLVPWAAGGGDDAVRVVKPPVVGFIGLPSAGKSSLINSLLLKRILATGVCRTTKAVHVIGAQNPFEGRGVEFHQHYVRSDDGVPMCLVDLPGVADVENRGTEKNFDELTETWVVNCDVIYWVSDVRTAFLTTHEKQEFDKITQILLKHGAESGMLHQMAIALSKFEDVEEAAPAAPAAQAAQAKVEVEGEGEKRQMDTDEILAEREDTTMRDCHLRVVKMFEGSGTPIVKFNAFGRILNDPSCSQLLVDLVKTVVRQSSPTNTQFRLHWAVDDLEDKQQRQYLNGLLNYYFPMLSKWIGRTCPGRWTTRTYGERRNDCPCLRCSTTTPSYRQCRWGVDKLMAEDCRGGEACSHHQKTTCVMGKRLTEACTDLCPQHIRQALAPIGVLMAKVTSNTALFQLFRFFMIRSQADLDAFQPIFKLNTTVYHSRIWNLFASRRSAVLDGLAPLAKQNNLLLLRDYSTPDVLYRLTKLVGPNHSTVTRMYLRVTAPAGEIDLYVSRLDEGAEKVVLIKPKLVEVLDPEQHPRVIEHDLKFAKDPLLMTRKPFLREVAQLRRQFWGDDEDEIDVTGICLCVWQGRMSSLLAPLPK